MFPCLNVKAEMESFNCNANIWAASVSYEERKPLMNIRSWWWWCTNAWRFKQTVKLRRCTELVMITYLYNHDSLKCGIVLQMNSCVSWLRSITLDYLDWNKHLKKKTKICPRLLKWSRGVDCVHSYFIVIFSLTNSMWKEERTALFIYASTINCL